jgi:hypothetical protein
MLHNTSELLLLTRNHNLERLCSCFFMLCIHKPKQYICLCPELYEKRDYVKYIRKDL